MNNIKIDGKEYVVLSKKEFNGTIDSAQAEIYNKLVPLNITPVHDLSQQEDRLIYYLCENVRNSRSIIVKLVGPDGTGVALFRFNLNDIKSDG